MQSPWQHGAPAAKSWEDGSVSTPTRMHTQARHTHALARRMVLMSPLSIHCFLFTSPALNDRHKHKKKAASTLLFILELEPCVLKQPLTFSVHSLSLTSHFPSVSLSFYTNPSAIASPLLSRSPRLLLSPTVNF